MSNQKSSKGLIFAGVVSAIAASLCCITPILALIAGASGAASTFSWIEPARPYLIGVTVLVLGFAWYQKLKPKRADIECACEEEKPSFWQSKLFLGIVTVFAVLMLAFPYYAHIFYPKTETKVIVVDSQNISKVNFEIEGMTCQGCEEHVKNAVSKLPGFIEATADHQTGKATIKFDNSKTSLEQVVDAINEKGYKVVGIKEK